MEFSWVSLLEGQIIHSNKHTQFIILGFLIMIFINLLQVFIVRTLSALEKKDKTCVFDIIATICILYLFCMTFLFGNDNLSDYLLLVGHTLLGGIIYRIRGGWLGCYIPGGTTPARIMWSTYVSLFIVYMLSKIKPEFNIGEYALYGTTTFVLSYIVMLIPHGRQMDLGHSNGSYAEDAWHMACIGTMRVLFIITPIATLDSGTLWAVWVGVVHPFVYTAGTLIQIPTRWENGNMKYPIDAPTAWGEYFWGQVQIFALISTFIFLGYGKQIFTSI